MKPTLRSSLKQWQPTLVWLTYAVGLAPAVWYFYLGATGGLGADPVKTFELFLGLWGLRFLILTLAVSPVRDLMGWNFIAYRRALGLLCFYYILLHFTVYLVLDQALDVTAVLNDTLKRPFIMFGMAGLAMLIPLALTSNRFSIRRMGAHWIRLHRLIYIIAACGVLHYALSTKVFSMEQLIYIGLIIALILYRSGRPILRNRKPRRYLTTSP
ncbi:protein-methionine-sulfoxide reductase heme-binding subunit MsrQ [Pararhizobium antarcticum]|uniref:Protein-methionine-sulfoxide reductase heme-binding subunit MsrQ n=1 Tax=Pararhizobium antarcticum TaxID=1798805 RepID=A0A657LXH7_9HYPH|nr:protein-methionine-sulfoxide reductase heme-binding subunit MsrQ [Pararhizobium antarcticum]OJF97651.1 sulfoxide reductase heme-binding subunit YedZ [Pararhizobium antarcticum]OJF99886.1 sulfoxide reductase heme-binding subunit YedZ [Rhizobium sp. 58]